MTVNSVLTHRNVGVLAVNAVEAPEVVTSAVDRRATRRHLRAHWSQARHRSPSWPASRSGVGGREGVAFDEAAAMAGRAAIDASGIDPRSDRHAHLDVGVQAPPRAVGRLCRAPSPRAADELPELRRRQCLPRVHQRHADRGRGDRRRSHRLRPDRRRRRQPVHAGDHDRAAAAADGRGRPTCSPSSPRSRSVRVPPRR